MNTKVKDHATNDEDALLAMHGFSRLPESFAMRTEDGMIQEDAPCYECRADGFYGTGLHGTHYVEGSIIVSGEVPNEHLQPLNRAAGVAYAKWLQSLPQTRANFDMQDMAEASQMLAKDPRVQELSPQAYQAALIKLCEELKIRREGKDARSLPAVGHNFTSASGGKSVPILGARMSDLSQRGPGSSVAPTGAGASKPAVRLAQPAAAAPIGGQR